ncbi:hypothetical protein [Natronobacterium haloterrestre]|uniref:hypothetical protein n=1 Tax=Natronobacterium haloterrestre TaxID=148448 RepID=UPI000B7FC954|nr:hypothetical protein [Halobiforma haloterrestris]
MTDLIPIVYYGGLSILFFFWIYGIVSFALDLKNTVIPGIRQYRRGDSRENERDPDDFDYDYDTDDERATLEEQLY